MNDKEQVLTAIEAVRKIITDETAKVYERVDQLGKNINRRIDNLERDFDRKFENLSEKFESNITKVAKLESVVDFIKQEQDKMDEKFCREIALMQDNCKSKSAAIVEQVQRDQVTGDKLVSVKTRLWIISGVVLLLMNLLLLIFGTFLKGRP